MSQVSDPKTAFQECREHSASIYWYNLSLRSIKGILCHSSNIRYIYMCGYGNKSTICIIKLRRQGLELNTVSSCLCKNIFSVCRNMDVYVYGHTHSYASIQKISVKIKTTFTVVDCRRGNKGLR